MADIVPPSIAPYYQDDAVTLWNGDCRTALREMESRSIDCVITDPPFDKNTHDNTRSNSNGARRRGNRVLSGSFGFDAITAEELRDQLEQMGRVTRRWVVAHMDYKHAFRFDDAPPAGLRLIRIGAWVKTNPNPQISGDRPAQGWEVIAYFHRADLAPKWNGGGRAANFYMPSAQRVNHPTAKPLEMAAQLVRFFSNPGDLIADFYAGSGTTLRAAKDEGRRAVGWEVDAAHCETASKRLIQDTLFGGVA